MNLRKRTLPLVLITALLLGTAAKCPKEEAPKPDPTFLLEVYSPMGYGPCSVTVSILGGKGFVPKDEFPLPSCDYAHEVSYKSGVKIQITLGLFVSKDGARDAFCKISDGPDNQLTKNIYVGKAVVCQLTTER